MLRISALWAVSLLGAAIVAAQNSMPLLEETSTRVSEHVWAIVGFPNIGIVEGSRATLVVDTGLGPRNGATIMRVVKKISTNQKLFLTTTHFHAEHTAGEAGFPTNTIIIRPTMQEQEVEKSLPGKIAQFSTYSDQNRELLAGVKVRAPDMVFGGGELKLDLGGVTARLLWLGTAHTQGDELIFVEPDSTLIAGDIVQDKIVPRVNRGEGSVRGWLSVLDKIESLKPRYIVPDHGVLGDGSLIAKERAFINDLQSLALALKHDGLSANDAGKQLAAEVKAKYPDWSSVELVASFVDRVYEEN